MSGCPVRITNDLDRLYPNAESKKSYPSTAASVASTASAQANRSGGVLGTWWFYSGFIVRAHLGNSPKMLFKGCVHSAHACETNSASWRCMMISGTQKVWELL
jgi:hypothetical protein